MSPAEDAHPQVKGRTVSQADTFHPAIAALHLSVPAVLGIVRHLMPQMLTEAHALWVYAHMSACQQPHQLTHMAPFTVVCLTCMT